MLLLRQILSRSEIKFFIPFAAEFAYQRLFEELVDTQTLAAAEHFGAFANFPAVIKMAQITQTTAVIH